MSTAAIADHNVLPIADEREPALPLRADTILGVCEAIGQDLGIHPNWLRIPLAALILWNAPVVIGAYLGLGCVVALSRWLHPAPRQAADEAVPATLAPPAVDNRESEELLAA